MLRINDPVLKAEMFEVYVRPIIMYFNSYGVEISKLKSAEGNALKPLTGVSTRCKSNRSYHLIGYRNQFLSELVYNQ
jgi:hypothetical protein